MFNKKALGNILSSFTKTQERLTAFLEANGSRIKDDQLALEVKEREQEKAASVKKKIEEFLGDK